MTVCNTIYLTRHGETDWNIEKKIQGSTDIPLNETGLNQAYQLANKIKDSKLEIDFIYTSSLKRAEDTAKIISHCNQIPFYSYDGLAEMNLGKWEGLTWSQVRNIYSTDYNIWHKERRYTIPPEGESYQQLLERFLNTINLLELYHKNILIVTHSAVIMTLLSYLNNTPFEEMHENYKTKNTELIKLTSEQCEKLFSPLN